jgi:hypothetical protein
LDGNELASCSKGFHLDLESFTVGGGVLVNQSTSFTNKNKAFQVYNQHRADVLRTIGVVDELKQFATIPAKYPPLTMALPSRHPCPALRRRHFSRWSEHFHNNLPFHS